MEDLPFEDRNVLEFRNYFPVALKAIADQISKKIIIVEKTLTDIEHRVYNLDIRLNPGQRRKQDLSDIIKAEELKDGIIQGSSRKKKNEIEDNELLSALRLINEGND